MATNCSREDMASAQEQMATDRATWAEREEQFGTQVQAARQEGIDSMAHVVESLSEAKAQVGLSDQVLYCIVCVSVFLIRLRVRVLVYAQSAAA